MKTSRILSVCIALAVLSMSGAAEAYRPEFQRLLDKYVYGASSSYCYDEMDRTTYDSGFNSSDFSSNSGIDIVNGKLVLNTDQRALEDTNRISINTRQELTVKYVYESADQSQSLAWFVWDDRVKKFTQESGYTYTKTSCSTDGDCVMGMTCRSCSGGGCVATKVCAYPRLVLKDTGVDGAGAANGVYDFFEKLWAKPGGTTDVYTLPYGVRPFPLSDPYPGYWQYDKYEKLWLHDYYNLNGSSMSDGGTYPRISNFLEELVDTGGQWLYLLADDDTDTETTVTCLSWDYGYGSCAYSVVHWQWGTFVLPPVKDSITKYDGIPDYDVNGDGVVDSDDRTVSMGTFDAGTELVFVLNSNYRNTRARYESVGMRRKSSFYYDLMRVGSMPYFSKKVLNPDYKSSGDYIRKLDIGCSYTDKWGYPGNTCGGVMGWLDKAAIDRLDTKTYNYLDLPHETSEFYTIEGGIRSHVFLGAPSTDPTRWILGFEQLYDGGPGGETNSGNDYNDIVILIERQNGGQVVSEEVVSEIPSGQLDSTTITKVRLKKDDYIPSPPCDPEPDTRIEYYITIGKDSLGNDVWIYVEFPPGSDEVELDLASMGYTGARLKWKVEIITTSELCHPVINDLDIGYEALVAGEYSFSSPIPLANVVVKGTTETASSSWTVTGGDTRNRGHFYLYTMYDPEDPGHTDVTKRWDAGVGLANRDPDSRTIYTHQGFVRQELKVSAATSWMLWEILDNQDRNLKNNGKKVYDLNGDGKADDNDARRVIEWTRGWEYPIGANPSSAPRRAWPLGAIHRSTSAIVTPPITPHWYMHPAVSPAIKASYDAWRNQASVSERPTIAVVGSQDGMLHAFDAGEYRYSDDPSTPIEEQRGYFKKYGATRNYGDGRELWAWLPPAHLKHIKNNYHTSFEPESHPWAQVNGSVAVDDVLFGTTWQTMLYISHGVTQPYLSAVDVTDPHNPQVAWEEDWTDPGFAGTYQSPTITWMNSEKYGGNGKTWAVATTSGMRDYYGDVYLYVIDADTGKTLPYGKVKMNTGGGNEGAKALGVWGSPVATDWDDDGYTDRFYFADSNGRVWKHYMNGNNHNRCLVIDVGPEPIYTTPAVKVAVDESTGKKVVALYFGTSDHPDKDDTPAAPYAFYGFVDRDEDLKCTMAELIYKETLPADEKVWADPFIMGDEVYFATSTGSKADICNEDTSNPGSVYSASLEADSSGNAILTNTAVGAGGNVVSSIMVYDEHLFLNSLGGTTKVLGGDTWNNSTASGSTTGPAGYEDIYWKEF